MNGFGNGNKLMRFLNRHAVKGLIRYVCALQAAGIFLYLAAPEFLFNYLTLNPAAILHGQIWRIVTFLVFPPAFSGGSVIGMVLFNVLAIYCIYIFGSIVESVWGAFRFNCYIVFGVLLNVAVAIAVYLLTGLPLILTPLYLVYSFFFVFALMFPENTILLMMVLPLKAKWIALGEAVLYVYSFVTGSFITRIEILVCIVHVFIFFGWMLFAGEGGYKQKARRRDFEKKMRPAAAVKKGHRCAVCGRTDQDSPGLEFRYCSKCEGSYEYCMDHLYTHKHVKKSDSLRNSSDETINGGQNEKD